MTSKLARSFLFVIVFFGLAILCCSQDTVQINGKNINPGVLKAGTHRYLVYFKMGKDAPRSETQFWTRTIERSIQNGRPVIKVNQLWEYKDTVLHTVTSICDAATMKPLAHEFWWKIQQPVKVNFETKSVTVKDVLLSDADTARRRKAIWSAYKSVGENYFLNWHLDMEVFPTLPYKKDVTFLIPFYDPGTTAPFENVAYTVTGTAQLTGYDNQKIDCWLMEHTSKGNKEVYWISKKTKEVLKLEQEINGTMYRYKIKLGFSI